MSDGSSQPQPQQPTGQAREPSAQAIAIDDTKVVPCYANFCRVTGTAEELIIDFGLNMEPAAGQPAPAVVTRRVITNFYTVKRLAHVLALTLERHERTFGALETDITKRILPEWKP